MRKWIEVLVLLIVFTSAGTGIVSCSGHQGKDTVIEADGMVRHVILWTLSDELDQEGKTDLIKYAETSLKEFVNTIPGLEKAEVIYKNRLDSSNCDFMFDMYFESREALEEFSADPRHQAVVKKMRPYIANRSCLDVAL